MALNEGLAFLLELAALGALAVWGAHTAGVALAIAAPVVAVVVWAWFAAPRARVDLSSAGKFAVACLVFGCASAGLIAAGDTWFGVALAVAFLANRLVLAGLGEPGIDPQ